MNTQITKQQNAIFKRAYLLSLYIFTLFAINQSYAQENTNTTQARIVKGMISDVDGPLPETNVMLKGSSIGTATDFDGKFTFPKKLKPGDILIFSYIGYEPQEIEIKDTTLFITLVLTEDMTNMIGALEVDTPYKSKRSNN